MQYNFSGVFSLDYSGTGVDIDVDVVDVDDVDGGGVVVVGDERHV